MVGDILWEQWIPACNNGDVEKIKQILVNHKEHTKQLCYYPNTLPYSIANNHLDLIKFLLTNNETKDYCDITMKNGYCIELACQSGNIEMIDFLYSLKPIQEKLFFYQNLGIKTSIAYDRKNVTKYFFEHKMFHNLGTPFAIKQLHESTLKEACFYECIDILKYLISEVNIQRTPEINAFIEDMLNSKRTKSLGIIVKDLFILKEYENLEEKIENKSINHTVNKVKI